MGFFDEYGRHFSAPCTEGFHGQVRRDYDQDGWVKLWCCTCDQQAIARRCDGTAASTGERCKKLARPDDTRCAVHPSEVLV